MAYPYPYGPRPGSFPVRVGQVVRPPTQQERETFTLENLTRAVQNITPSLIVAGIAAGAAAAIGSALVARYVFPSGGRRR